MVVLALLTLFAILGISFVLYANAQSQSSDLLLQAEADPAGLGGPDVSVDTLAGFLFNALIYGVDDANGIYSAYRGYDFARSIFGYNYAYDPVTQSINRAPNGIPYHGVGRIHEQINFPNPSGPPIPVDGYNLVNYMCFQDATGKLVDGMLRDP